MRSALPFWDPQRKAYDVARAALGAIEAQNNPKLSNEAQARHDAAEIALSPRRALGAPRRRSSYLGDRSWFWLLLGAGPLAVLALRGTTLLGRSARDRWRARRQAHQTRANLALREAQAAAHRNEAAAAASAVERAVHLAIEAKARPARTGCASQRACRHIGSTRYFQRLGGRSGRAARGLRHAALHQQRRGDATRARRSRIPSGDGPPSRDRSPGGGRASSREHRVKSIARAVFVLARRAVPGDGRGRSRSRTDAPEKTFADAATAIERGAYDEAIDRLELLADQGFSHPDASFNRAVAYLARAQSARGKTGDFGRAVAALAETLLLRPGDAEAEQALERVQAEIARRRAREGRDQVTARPSLARAVTGLADENVWDGLAAVGSLLLSAGLLLRWWSVRSTWRLGANTHAGDRRSLAGHLRQSGRSGAALSNRSRIPR